MGADSSKMILARGLLAELPEPPKPYWFAVAPNRSGGGAYDAPSRGRSLVRVGGSFICMERRSNAAFSSAMRL